MFLCFDCLKSKSEARKIPRRLFPPKRRERGADSRLIFFVRIARLILVNRSVALIASRILCGDFVETI